MGDLINLNAQEIGAIPDEIARDTEVTVAVAAHVSDLHPSQIFGFGQGVSTENVFDFGSGFLDCRQGGGVFPPGMGHIQGFQARFAYTAGKWGMQLVTQNSTDNECYFRTVNWDNWGPWRRIWNDGNFNPGNYLLQSEGDGRYRQSAVALTDSDISAAIARDTETAAAIAAHASAADPHPVYLTQAEGDGRYRQSAVALTDSDIPAAIARDAETAAAIAGHVAAVDPHPVYLTQAEGDTRYTLSKIINFTTTSNSNQSFGVPHGLSFSKIVGFTSVIETGSNLSLIPPNVAASGGFAYTISADASNIYFSPGASNAGLASKVGRFVIFYLP